VIGWLRPVILLPASALTGLSLPQLDAIIAHELAHVRRHDFAVNLLQSAAEILLFYHPACWWISRRVRAERELCCDDVAVSVCGDCVLYATALADLEALRVEPALALAATDGPLLQRVRRLLAPSPAGSRVPGLAAALVPAALLALVMTGATLTASPAPPALPQNDTAALARTVPAGHGVVRGQIVDAQSGRPVAGASYEITGPEDSVLGRSGDDGRFETRPIKAGTYTMSARAKGYVMGWFGPRESPFGAPIDVRAGRVSSGIDVKMYASGAINGRIVEIGPVAEVIHRPQHPYTTGLMGSIPSIVEERERLTQIDGSMPRLTAIPSGCAFHPRCPYVFDRCRHERPELLPAGATRAACWLRVDGKLAPPRIAS